VVKWLIPFLAVFIAAPQVTAQAPHPEFLLVPGRSAGRVAIGMQVATLTETLGRPAKIENDGGRDWYTWQDRLLRSIAVETAQDVVILISIAHDPRYRTRDGLGDGATADQVEHALGRPSSLLRLPGYDLLEYRSRGIAFVVDGSRHVTGIVVAPPVRGGRATLDRSSGTP
jgi:hypothetical protein